MTSSHRRVRLVWFALGCGAAALACVAGSRLRPAPSPPLYVVLGSIAEPMFPAPIAQAGGRRLGSEAGAGIAAKIFSTCGIRRFAVETGVPEPTLYGANIRDAGADEVACLFAEAQRENVSVSVSGDPWVRLLPF